MDNSLSFIRLNSTNLDLCKVFELMMYDYIDEMNEHSHRPLPKEFQKKWIDSIISLLNSVDRYLEICIVNDKPVGFLYGKIDRYGDKGYIRPGYAYIMEFYVKTEYRRKGFATQMFGRLQSLFKKDGAKIMYLTADPITGKPFWEHMGFIETNEVNPDNQMIIYEKVID